MAPLIRLVRSRPMAVLSIGLCLLAAMPIGCATLDEMIQKPKATFKNMRLTDASLLQSTAVFDFDVSNPNPIGIHARSISYDLKLNGNHFVKGELDQGISLDAGGTSRMSIPVTMRYLDFYQTLTRLWQNESAEYDLNGGFSVGPFTIPFQAKGRFNLPRMPKIDVEAIEIKKLSFTGAALNCRLKLYNPNTFNLLFKKLNYDLKLGGTSFATASAQPKGPIAQKGQSVVNLGFNVSFSQLGHSAFRLLQGAKADYSLDGTLVFDDPAGGGRQAPFKLNGRVPLVR